MSLEKQTILVIYHHPYHVHFWNSRFTGLDLLMVAKEVSSGIESVVACFEPLLVAAVSCYVPYLY